jgi:hypothetical protein
MFSHEIQAAALGTTDPRLPPGSAERPLQRPSLPQRVDGTCPWNADWGSQVPYHRHPMNTHSRWSAAENDIVAGVDLLMRGKFRQRLVTQLRRVYASTVASTPIPPGNRRSILSHLRISQMETRVGSTRRPESSLTVQC